MELQGLEVEYQPPNVSVLKTLSMVTSNIVEFGHSIDLGEGCDYQRTASLDLRCQTNQGYVRALTAATATVIIK